MAPSLRLPCLSCHSPQADDVRFYAGTGMWDEERNRSPSGLPILCCRVRFMGVVPEQAIISTPPSAAGR
jgi:hypothetical protein